MHLLSGAVQLVRGPTGFHLNECSFLGRDLQANNFIFAFSVKIPISKTNLSLYVIQSFFNIPILYSSSLYYWIVSVIPMEATKHFFRTNLPCSNKKKRICIKVSGSLNETQFSAFFQQHPWNCIFQYVWVFCCILKHFRWCIPVIM